MILLSPFVLLGLIALPAIWWLIRATPPAPRETTFPSLILLERLKLTREDATHAPLWLLLLRILAVALIIFGLARPILLPTQAYTHRHSLTLIIDNGWASIPHWNDRVAAAQVLGQASLRHGHPVTILLAARTADGSLPEPFTTQDDRAFSNYLSHIQPEPWPVDRSAVTKVVTQYNLASQDIIILSDGVASSSDEQLQNALKKSSSVEDMRWKGCGPFVLHITPDKDGAFTAKTETLSPCADTSFSLRAMTSEGNTLASFPLKIGKSFSVSLPVLARNQLDHFSLEGMKGPATTFLLGDANHRKPVGVLQTPGDTTPLLGSAFYLKQALDTQAELRTGDANTLLSSPLSVIIATDGALSGDQTKSKILAWVRHGGMLIRFAGPDLAAPSENQNQTGGTSQSDPLIPVPLMNGMRQLGGPMSWGKPQALASFPASSPFAELTIPAEVNISRQVLAKPDNDLSQHVWASLQDGTPLVTARAEGNGEIVLFHVTSAPDWSNLPLSGLFPDMLERLINRSAGINGKTPSSLMPWRILSVDGELTPPSPAATSIHAKDFKTTDINVFHPVGLYGPARATHALNLADHIPTLHTEPLLGTAISPDGAQPERPLGPSLIFAGLILLLVDLTLSLKRRGIVPFAIMLLICGFPYQAYAQSNAPSASLDTQIPQAALETRLAYIITGHDDIDAASRAGLEGLSNYTSARSSASLGHPDGVIPGKDDLAFYPLLYWPITADAQPDPARIKALNAFMEHGGILLIDEQGAGTEVNPSSMTAIRTALQRVTDGLTIPPLTTLNDKNVLSHTFYLLHNNFSGRISGEPVYIAREGDEANDDVSPVIIGNADWAHAWATDTSGNHPYAVIPGGEDQRTLAYRFGMNVVLYALTGNYKADQAHYPEMLHRLGQNSPNDPSSQGAEGNAP
ncbi:DUF4159 domain-containing protein [Swingsia samuiensis]|uniref:DUF4159 domain-containing protein n=1 Tax=Swingsia samuiensis TaxID=1293412 RepID=A0A4Y6UHD7_9PROT|nr:DUF4159 domain-containing protein [Swingsia samuiensis]QDH16444.1 DUF4159 domain-containing protein [Swingsia samuiensis]